MDSIPAAAKRLLLVEDHLDLARDMAALIQDSTDDKLQVTCAATLAEAKRMTQQQHFDAIITDYNFPTEQGQDPHPNGITLIQQIRAGEWGSEIAKLPIAFQSGDNSHATMQAARNGGATLCRVKTGPLEVLLDFLTDVVENRPPARAASR